MKFTVAVVSVLALCCGLISGQPEGVKSLKWQEEFRFGPDRSDEVYLWSGDYLSLTSGEKWVYVVDPANNRVTAFDDQGRFVKNVGGAGEGPGE